MVFFSLEEGLKGTGEFKHTNTVQIMSCLYLVHSVQKLRVTGNHAFDLCVNMYSGLM